MSDQDSKGRKQAPKVEDEEEHALVAKNGLEPTGDLVSTKSARAPVEGATVPEPKTWSQRLDFNKLVYGQKLIGWCIFLIFALTLIDYFVAKESGAISGTIEMLKLITTTALGFVFAKTQDAGKNPDD